MAGHKSRYGDFYVIEIEQFENEPALDYTRVDPSLDANYSKLLDMEKNRELKSEHPTVVPRACLKQTPDMLVEDYYDENTRMNKKRFKDELITADSDSKGRNLDS